MKKMPEGTPIQHITFDEIQTISPRIRGWIYPKRSISSLIPLFSKPQKAAINLYGWISILCGICGLILPFALGTWWYLLLIPGTVLVWTANRRSVEQFFLENIQSNQAFYEAVKETDLAAKIKVVFD